MKFLRGLAVAVLFSAPLWASALVSPAPVSTFSVGGWSRTSIQSASSAAAMPRVGSNGNNYNAPWVAPWDGEVVGISAATENGSTLNASAYSVTVYVNGTATGASALALGGDRMWNGSPTPVTFSAGDAVELRDSKVGAVNNVPVQAQFFAHFTP